MCGFGPWHNRPTFVMLEHARKGSRVVAQGFIFYLLPQIVKNINTWRCMDELFIFLNGVLIKAHDPQSVCTCISSILHALLLEKAANGMNVVVW